MSELFPSTWDLCGGVLWADLDIEAIIKIAFFIIFLFGSAFVKLISTIMSKAGERKAPPVQRPVVPGQQPVREFADPVRREVDDFLRRMGVDIPDQGAAGRRNQEEAIDAEVVAGEATQRSRLGAPLPREGANAGGAGGGSGGGVGGGGGTGSGAGNRPRKKKPRREREEGARPRELGQRESYENPFPRGQRVEQHVRQHLDPSSIQQHAQSLGQNVAQTDERIEGHLRDKFQHSVGNLSGGKSTQKISEGTDASDWERVPVTNATALRIRQMLQSRNSFRDAMIVSEILRPPTLD